MSTTTIEAISARIDRSVPRRVGCSQPDVGRDDHRRTAPGAAGHQTPADAVGTHRRRGGDRRQRRGTAFDRSGRPCTCRRRHAWPTRRSRRFRLPSTTTAPSCAITRCAARCGCSRRRSARWRTPRAPRRWRRSEWKRLAKMVEDSGIAADGAAWVAAARADTLAALASMGTANARQLGKAVPALTEKLHLAVGKSVRGHPGHAHPVAAATSGSTARSCAAGRVDPGPLRPVHLVGDRPVAAGWPVESGRCRHRRRGAGPPLSRPFRPGDSRRPAVVGRMDVGHDPDER